MKQSGHKREEQLQPTRTQQGKRNLQESLFRMQKKRKSFKNLHRQPNSSEVRTPLEALRIIADFQLNQKKPLQTREKKQTYKS